MRTIPGTRAIPHKRNRGGILVAAGTEDPVHLAVAMTSVSRVRTVGRGVDDFTTGGGAGTRQPRFVRYIAKTAVHAEQSKGEPGSLGVVC